MKNLRWLAIPCVLLLAATSAACGDDDSDDDASVTNADESAVDEVDEVDEDLTIGVSYPTTDNPFWQNYIAFVEEGGQQLGIELNGVSADNDEQKQISDIENLVSLGVDGLVITPVTTGVASTLLRTATDADLPVVVVDRFPEYEPGEDPSADYAAFIGPNDVQAGRGIAETLIEMGATEILALGGPEGTSVAEGRRQGLEEAIDADPEATIVQYLAAGDNEEDGLNAMENLLQAHPSGSADGVWCFNDATCLGALQALQNDNRLDEFVVGGMDLAPEAVAAIERGDYDVSFGGHWLQGGFGLVMLYDLLNGHEPSQELVQLDLLRVGSGNVAEFLDQYIDNPPEYDFQELSKSTNPDATGFFEITLEGEDAENGPGDE